MNVLGKVFIFIDIEVGCYFERYWFVGFNNDY